MKLLKCASIVVLIILTFCGYYVSFENLHTMFATYGSGSETSAYLSAGMLDTLGLVGLGTGLAFRKRWSRFAFVVSILFSGAANMFVGFVVGGPLGLVVALVPFICLEISYRVGLDLMLEKRPSSSESQKRTTEPVAELVESSAKSIENQDRSSAERPAVPSNSATSRKLNQATADEIRELHRSGVPQKGLAQKYGVAASTVSEIISGKRWASKQAVKTSA